MSLCGFEVARDRSLASRAALFHANISTRRGQLAAYYIYDGGSRTSQQFRHHRKTSSSISRSVCCERNVAGGNSVINELYSRKKCIPIDKMSFSLDVKAC